MLAALLLVILGLKIGWNIAIGWFDITIAVELTYRLVFRGTFRSIRRKSSPHLINFTFLTVLVFCWNSVGFILWMKGGSVCDILAVAYFGGYLLYLQTHHSSSPVAMLPVVPSFLTLVLLPLVFPHQHGLDQLLIIVMMGSIVGHAVVGALVSMAAAQRLTTAAEQLVVEKARAERAVLESTAALDDAQAASRAKSTFLATMSHEIRTPLNGVLGMAQAMARDQLPPAQQERLAVIRQSGEALLAILNDVLDLSKIEAGRLDLESVVFDLDELMMGAYATFTAIANKQRLSFGLSITETAKSAYLGDPTRIRQMLYNLISNALKFTQYGEVRVEADYHDGELSIAVCDTGIGIPATAVAAVFQSFTQVDASTTRHFGGTGLGLSICKHIAQMMNGDITVQSTLGEGSRFTITLKIEQVDRVGDAATHQEAIFRVQCVDKDQSELRVLAAEDNQVNQLVLRTLLAQVGIDPVIVVNGEEAVAAWRSRDWDVILMDMQMPVLDGISATKVIRAEEAASGRDRTPIIALTANAMSHQVEAYRACGMDGHVSKPVEIEKLFEMLDRVIAFNNGALEPTDKKAKRDAEVNVA
jgi:signal transduction histidine kinase/CheY-like chemotaxis protein